MLSTPRRLAAAVSLAALPLSLAAGPAGAQCSALSAAVGCSAPSTTTTTVPPSTSQPSPNPSPSSDPAPRPAEPQVSTSAGARLLQLANGERASAGLPPMSMRGDVTDIAEGWSVKMAKAGTISHNDAYFTPSTRSRLGAKSLGENVGTSGDVDDIHRRLMNSPPHRANLMNARFTVVGMGAVRTSSGQWYVTQNFMEPVAVAPAAAAPAGPVTRKATGTTVAKAPAKPAAAPVAKAPAQPVATTTAPAPAAQSAPEQQPAPDSVTAGHAGGSGTRGPLPLWAVAIGFMALVPGVVAGFRPALRLLGRPTGPSGSTGLAPNRI